MNFLISVFIVILFTTVNAGVMYKIHDHPDKDDFDNTGKMLEHHPQGKSTLLLKPKKSFQTKTTIFTKYSIPVTLDQFFVKYALVHSSVLYTVFKFGNK